MSLVLVDTSVWIQYFREGRGRQSDVLEELIKSGQACTAGIVLAELAAGARTDKQRSLVLNLLDPLPFLQTGKAEWLASGEYRGQMLKTGAAVPLPDLILAATAIAHDASVFTMDKHFSKISEIVPLKIFTE